MKQRCPWLNLKNKLYIEYHDREWGRPVREDNKHFELITLEGAQAGLSWETVLNKREHYRKVFVDFDPKKIARFDSRKVEALLRDPGIIRNRLKVESTVSNAKAFLSIQKEFGTFDNFIWNYVNYSPIINTFDSIKDYPSNTPLSDLISKDLKKRGFRFVGSTIVYAYMQAAGLTQDHSLDCYLGDKKLKQLK
jgi:DNA-3-methyladenine glycosylase I